MRLRVVHRTVYTYAEPMTRAIQTLRVRPRSHEGQFVGAWRIDVDADCRLYRDEDPYGNLTDTFYIDGPSTKVTVSAEGEIETFDTAGVIRGTAERLPLPVFLRETPSTTTDPAIRDLADRLSANEGGDPLSTLHALKSAIFQALCVGKDATAHAIRGAAAAYATGSCGPEDVAHVFVAAARHLGVPTRFVSGYLFRETDGPRQAAGHAWAEAHVPDLGWIGFDAANDTCVTEAYVRVAAGMDYLDAAPVRGAQTGSTDERVDFEAVVEPARVHNRPLPVTR
jgi:transglutaminase-like putative cysteine protease